MPLPPRPAEPGMTEPVGQPFVRGHAAMAGMADDVSNSPGPIQVRLMRHLMAISSRLTSKQIAMLEGYPSDAAMFWSFVGSPQALETVPKTDPLAAARSRAPVVKQHLLDRSGGCLTAAEIAERLGISPQAVYKRVRSDKLLAVEAGRHKFAFPTWQIENRHPIDGLEQALAAFRVTGAWAKLSFFLSYDPVLGETPLDALRAGRTDAVVGAAAAYGGFGG